MILTIRMKNATTSPKSWVGQEIQPGDYYQIQSQEKEAWENDSQVLSDITAGNLVVNDGQNDLFPDDGIQRLQAEAESERILFKSDSYQSKTVKEGIIEASEQCRGVIGMTIQMTFKKVGVLLQDGYLSGSGLLSYPCLLRSFMVNNANPNADFDIEIGDLIFQFRNLCSGYRNNINVSFYEGDFVSLFAKRKGIDPEDLEVNLLFQVSGLPQTTLGDYHGRY